MAVKVVLVSGWIHNTACVADIESNVAQSREISGITEAHINWVNQLNSHLQKGTAFTGSLDHTTCSFGTWASALTPAFKSDNIIAAALNNINDPHTLIHNKAAEIIELNKIDPEAAYSAYEHNILPNVPHCSWLRGDIATESHRSYSVLVESAEVRMQIPHDVRISPELLWLFAVVLVVE